MTTIMKIDHDLHQVFEEAYRKQSNAPMNFAATVAQARLRQGNKKSAWTLLTLNFRFVGAGAMTAILALTMTTWRSQQSELDFAQIAAHPGLNWKKDSGTLVAENAAKSISARLNGSVASGFSVGSGFKKTELFVPDNYRTMN